MPARVIATSRNCVEGKCPTLLETASGDIAVQGYVITNPVADLPKGHVVPAGETVVRIPADVFDQLALDYLADKLATARKADSAAAVIW